MKTGIEALLKDGRKVSIQHYRPEDKDRLVAMYASLSKETLRWSLPPYDRQRVERWTADLENKIILVAFSNDSIVGHLQITSYPMERLRGISELIIYLHQDFQNAGLGAAMIPEGILEAKARHLHRVRLSVVAENHRAISLYEKVGFQTEGISRDNYYGEDGTYYDVVEMGLILD